MTENIIIKKKKLGNPEQLKQIQQLLQYYTALLQAGRMRLRQEFGSNNAGYGNNTN